MARMLHVAALCVLALPALALSQTPPAKFDAAGLVANLNNPDKHAAAAELLKGVGEDALVPLWREADDEQTPSNVRKDILDAFPDVYKRLREARATKEEALAKAWNRKIVDSYNKFGNKDAKWDALAVAALTDGRKDSATLGKLRAARAAGCNDPLIRLFEMTVSQETRKIGLEHAVADYPRIVADMGSSHYPESIKFLAYARLLRLYEEPGSGLGEAHGTEALNKVIQLMPAFFAEKPGAAIEEDYLRRILCATGGVHFNHKTEFDELSRLVAKSFPDGWQTDAFTGWFYIDYGFDARGHGYAESVTEEGGKLFGARVEVAGNALQRGWEADPLNSCCAAAMISICTYQDSERATMESWFQKAMLADPDCLRACANKLTYLSPGWGRTHEEMLLFGRECVKMGNGRNGIPGILLNTVLEGQFIDPDLPIDPDYAERYMRRPQVWADVKSACEKLLADKSDLTRSPDQYLSNRGLYLRLACQCGQWDTVVRLADEFGDQVDLEKFGGKALYTYYITKARDAARQGK